MASGKDSITPVSFWPFSLCRSADGRKEQPERVVRVLRDVSAQVELATAQAGGATQKLEPLLTSRDSAGDTVSLDSAITQYRLENGRRYHAYRDGNYW